MTVEYIESVVEYEPDPIDEPEPIQEEEEVVEAPPEFTIEEEIFPLP